MKDVYYNPAEYEPSLFSSLEDNIKEDRTPEDLLFQVMLDLGILLSSKIQVRSEKVGMRNYSYFDVEDGYLIACFDKNIDEEVITAIAKQNHIILLCVTALWQTIVLQPTLSRFSPHIALIQ